MAITLARNDHGANNLATRSDCNSFLAPGRAHGIDIGGFGVAGKSFVESGGEVTRNRHGPRSSAFFSAFHDACHVQ